MMEYHIMFGRATWIRMNSVNEDWLYFILCYLVVEPLSALYVATHIRRPALAAFLYSVEHGMQGQKVENIS